MAQAALTRRRLLAGFAGTALLHGAVQAAALRREHRVLFGSLCELIVPSAAALPDSVRAALWQRLAQMNAGWNAWKPGALTTLNDALRAGRPARVTPALRAVLQSAQRLEAASGGCFNAAIGGLVGAWGFHADDLRGGSRPHEAVLRRWRGALPTLAQLEWRGDQVLGHHPALQIDLGGYAKGVAVDDALDRLHAVGVHDAVLNLGGNLATLGQGADGPWRIGIRDPFGDGLLGSLQTGAREAVVTSGLYERYRWLDGERCGHVIDPRRAAPADELVSVTVVHPSAGVADAAATALLAAGAARWPRVAERMALDQVLVVERDGRVRAHARLARRVAFVSAEWRGRLTTL